MRRLWYDILIHVLMIILCLIGGVLGVFGWVVTSILMPVTRRLRGRGGPAAPTGVA